MLWREASVSGWCADRVGSGRRGAGIGVLRRSVAPGRLRMVVRLKLAQGRMLRMSHQ